MFGFHRCYFFTGADESCVEYDPRLYQSRHGPFHSVVNHHSPDKRYSCFPSHIMAFIPYFLWSLHTPDWHQILYLWWLPAEILQGNVSGWTGLLLVSNPLLSCFVKIAHTLCSIFFAQDHRYHKYHSNDHVILSFVLCSSSNVFHDSEHRIDECHGQSSIQEYDAIRRLERERERDFYHPFSRRLNKNKNKNNSKVSSRGRRIRVVRRSKQ